MGSSDRPGMILAVPLWRLPDDHAQDPAEAALKLRARHARALGHLRPRRAQRRAHPRVARPVRSTTVTSQDFATTLQDGRRVIGRHHRGQWSVHVYSPHDQPRLLGYGRAATRPEALERAGLSGEDAGEVLGRVGI
jgi:hypothetical protein